MTSSKNSKKQNDSSSKLTFKQLLEESITKLVDAGVNSARTDALVLLETVLNRNKTWVLSHSEEIMPAESLSAFLPLLNRRANREPLAYITGVKDFYGLKYQVTPSVLIPRPETEALVEHVIENAPKNSSVIDVGTGSGAIAIAIAANRADLLVEATDRSQNILNISSKNGSAHNLNILFVQMNLLGKAKKRYDVICANLPYLPMDWRLQPELDHEPASSLYSGVDGLDLYRQFIPQIPSYLTSGGYAIIEHDPSQTKKLNKIALQSGLVAQSVTSFISTLTTPNK